MTDTFVLRYRAEDGTYAVATLEQPAGTTLEQATEIAFEQGQEQGLLLERITNTATGEAGELGFAAANAPKRGFGK
jgi:hypothetical protein